MFLSRLPTGEPEIFATVQGEGPSIGVPSVFVRLAHCNLRCTWCFVPETPILMADWSWRRIGDLAPGDSILGVERPSDGGRHLRLAQGLVLARSEHRAETVVVNESLRCTPDHGFWLTGKDEQGRSTVHSGWREISRAVGKRALFVTEPPAFPLDERAYERGWLAGMADGDGCFWTLKLASRRGEYRRFRLALQERALLTRAASYASRAGFELRPGTHRSSGFGRDTQMDCLWLTVDEEARRFEEWLARPSKSRAFDAGYLGGILDAEGSFSVRALRVHQFRSANPVVYPRIAGVLERLGVKATEGERGFYLHRSGGAAWRALAHAKPSKRSILRGALGSHPHASRVIRTVEPSGQTERVVTLSTSLGSFIASGFVVKNCDTAYTWDWSRFDREEHVTRRTVDEVVSRVIALAGEGHRNVVITGGEPLLQQAEVEHLAKDLRSRGYTLEVETNGTLEPSEALASQIAQWNVSPKLTGSGNERATRYKPSALQWFAERPSAYFKFVVASDEEVVEATEMISALHVSTNRVILMPEGTDPETISARSKWLADRCRAHGYRLGTRLHLYIWGAERAR